jgi:hypothetical protein
MAARSIAAGEKPGKGRTSVTKDPAARSGASRKDRPKTCRAMTQQRTDSGQPSTPQKFVRLVGCHDPNAGRSGGR